MHLAVALVGTLLATTSPPLTFSFRTNVDVLAFADDGTQALLLETTTAGPTTTTTLLFADANGVRERLPISDRTKGIRGDRVPVEVCEKNADKVAAVARDFEGISVVIGLCAGVERNIVTALQQPRPQVVSKEIGVLHQQVGFIGKVFVADRDGIVVVVGENVDGSPRIAVTKRAR